MNHGKGTSVVWGAVALAMVGCGGGGGGHKASNPGNSGQVSDAVRFATLATIETEVDKALTAGTPDAQLAQTIRSQPGIAAAEADPSGSVWAQFSDGRLVVIPPPGAADFGDEDEGETPFPPSGGRGIPSSRNAYLFDTLGSKVANASPAIHASLGGGGYLVKSAATYNNASIDALKTVKNAAAFYLDTHGGAVNTVGRMGKMTVSVTTTKPSPENDERYKADLADGSINYTVVRRMPDGTVRRRVSKRYCITRNFVRKYMTFAPHSVAIVDYCSSYRYDDMAQAFRDKGASVYLGWSNTIQTGDAAKAMDYFFDRLVGANAADPAEPGGAQRPFGYADILEAMGKKSPSLSAYTGMDGKPTLLTMTEDPEGGLAPSIQNMDVNEASNELTLLGEFPDEEGTVQINGHNLTIKEWDENRVVVDLPVSGEDSSGDVVVWYQGRKSNVATLTEWNGSLKYTLEDEGTLKESMQTAVRVRADARNFRLKAGDPLVDALAPFNLTSDMTGSYAASGSHDDGIQRTDWEGSATLRAPQVAGGNGVWFNGAIMEGKIWFHVHFFQDKAKKKTITSKSSGTKVYDDPATGLKGAALLDNVGKIEIPLNTSDYTFPAGSRTSVADSEIGAFHEARSKLEWTAFTPKHPPHPNTGR